MNVLPSTAIFLLLHLTNFAQGQTINRILCPNRFLSLSCGSGDLIDVQAVTYAGDPSRTNPFCTVTTWSRIIANAPAHCKRAATATDEAIRRCHGLTSCRLDHASGFWGEIQPGFGCISQALLIQYRCHSVSTPYAAILPSWPSSAGPLIHVMTPYYPCSPPTGPYDIRCTAFASRAVAFAITPKHMWLEQSTCADALSVHAHTATPHMFCAPQTTWNGVPYHTAGGITNIAIQFKTTGQANARFWITIEAFEERFGRRQQVDITVTCSVHGATTQLPPPSSTCLPFRPRGTSGGTNYPGTSSNTTGLSTGKIAGGAGGGSVFGIVCLIIFIYCCCCRETEETVVVKRTYW